MKTAIKILITILVLQKRKEQTHRCNKYRNTFSKLYVLRSQNAYKT